MSLANGELPPLPQLKIIDPVVDLLERLLVMAKNGQFNTLAVIAITPQGAMTSPYIGPRLGDLIVGTELLKDDIKNQLRAPQQPRPGIIRPMIGG